MHYRPEIDGLRAVAIIPAVFYHAGFGVAFAAVDIFFVVSGYLITTIILKDLAQDKFSLIYFYERRVRRILPAMFFIMLVCLPFAWFWLMPPDFRQFSKSIIGVATFTSNLVFLSQNGYFEPEVSLKPLMAMWSLAVEEQYYIIFPMLMMLIWHFAKRLLAPTLIVLFFMSLGYAEWAALNDPTAAYYILQTRGWELLVGAFAAMYLLNKSEKAAASSADQALSLIGIFLMFYSFLFFDPQMTWPGLYALMPTGGTVLVILFATNGTVAKWLLSNRLLVGIGLISYSVYLWHQPIFAFYRHYALGQTSTPVYMLLIVLSYLLAILSYRYIETPFRNRHGIFTQKAVFIMALVACISFVAIGTYGPALAKEHALSNEQKKFLYFFTNLRPEMHYMEREGLNKHWRHDCNFYDFYAYKNGRTTEIPIARLAADCIVKDPSKAHSVLLWGDSHGQMLRYGLDQNMPSDWQILQIASSNCTPEIGYSDSATNFCERSNWTAWNILRKTRPDVVIIARRKDHNIQSMSDMADQLLAAGIGKVVFTGPAPHWFYNLPAIITRRFIDDTPKYTKKGIMEDYITLDKQLTAGAKGHSNFEYVSLINYFCNDDGCLTYVGDDRKSGLTTFDYGHLTLSASDYFVRDALVDKVVAQ